MLLTIVLCFIFLKYRFRHHLGTDTVLKVSFQHRYQKKTRGGAERTLKQIQKNYVAMVGSGQGACV